MAVLVVLVPLALASHHKSMTPMGLVVEQTSWLLPHTVNVQALLLTENSTNFPEGIDVACCIVIESRPITPAAI